MNRFGRLEEFIEREAEEFGRRRNGHENARKARNTKKFKK